MLDVRVVEKLDRIYCCAQCKAVFLFKSDDVSEHEEMFVDHNMRKELPLI